MPETRSATKVDKHIGARIRMRRLEQGLSQEGLAEKLGVSFQQVQKYEKGTNRVASGKLQAAADALDTSVAFFYENAPGKHSDGDSSEMTAFMTSPDGVALAQAFMSLPDDGRLRRNVRDVVVGIAACQNNLARSAHRRAA